MALAITWHPPPLRIYVYVPIYTFPRFHYFSLQYLRLVDIHAVGNLFSGMHVRFPRQLVLSETVLFAHKTVLRRQKEIW